MRYTHDMSKQKVHAIIYTRQSVHREESISHEIQEQACRSYAASKGYEVIRVETDPGISGLNLDKRKALARSLASVQAGEASVIIVWRWSRLSRARHHQALLLSDVEEAGGQVESALEPMDATASGRFGRDVLLAMAAFESEQKKETWKQTYDRRLKKGLTPQGAGHFGYVQNADKDQAPTLDPATAPLVKEGYEMYLRGVGFKRIAEYWTKKGTTSMGGAVWAEGAVRRVLDNPFYSGQFSFRNELHPGAHEPLLTAGEWSAYRAKRKERTTEPARTKSSPWAFAGLAVCARCGSSMVRNEGRGVTYLFCTRRRKTGACEGVTALLTEVNLSIWSWFGSHLKEWAGAVPASDVAIAAADKAISDMQRNVSAAQERIDGLLTRAVRLDLPDEQIAAPLKEFRTELAAASEGLDAALAHRATYTPATNLYEVISRGTEHSTTEEWRDTVRKVIAGVVILPDRQLLLVPRGEDVEVW